VTKEETVVAYLLYNSSILIRNSEKKLQKDPVMPTSVSL
jgi:hypothetical protein